jgi:hypothetical protein
MWEKDQRSSGEYSKVIHYLSALPSLLLRDGTYCL